MTHDLRGAHLDGARRKAQKPLTRIEKTELTYRALIAAAAKVIGKYGYADATIARITQEANVAQGTFYNYFSSRQELFDKLLPLVGVDLIDFIRSRRAENASLIEKEREGFTAFFDFLLDVPGFFRLLTEAETIAPVAHKAHIKNMVSGYVRSLTREKAEGELANYSEAELEVLAYILISARHYLAMRFAYDDGGVHRLPVWVVDTYAKFLTHGLSGGEAPRQARRQLAAEEATEPAAAAPDAQLVRAEPGLAVAEISLSEKVVGNAVELQAALSAVATTAALGALNAVDERHELIVASSHCMMIEPPGPYPLQASARLISEPSSRRPVVAVAISQGVAPAKEVAVSHLEFCRP